MFSGYLLESILQLKHEDGIDMCNKNGSLVRCLPQDKVGQEALAGQGLRA